METFAEYAKRLHAPEKGVTGVSLRGGAGGELTLLNLLLTANQGAWVLDSPEAIDAVEGYASLAEVAQATAATDGYLEFAWNFYEGRAAMMLHNDDAVKAVQDRYLGIDRYGSCRLPSGPYGPHLALAGFGVGVHAKSSLVDLAGRYACEFVEGYAQNLEAGARELGITGNAGGSCGPMRPWPVDRDPLLEPFRQAMEDSARLHQLPWGNPAFVTWLVEQARPDVRALFTGELAAKDLCSRWTDTWCFG